MRRAISLSSAICLSFVTAWPVTAQLNVSAASQPAGPAAHEHVALLDDGTALLERMQLALAELVRRVGPAVVAIQADRNPASLGQRDGWTPRMWTSTGSGVLIRADGMILTSQHVIDGAAAIHVVLHDGRRVLAQRIADDRRSDLAIIRIRAENLKIAELGDADTVERGHIVMALGNPLGLSSDGQAAVSHGLVSAIGRPLPEAFGREEDRYYGDMIQTTAPINPGNSGGPLVDIRGRVIGVITAVSTRSDGYEGIGFAVPLNQHTRVIVDKLLRGQLIDYGFVGVDVDDVPDRLRQRAGLPATIGAMLAAVHADGPAARAGLEAGDIVVAVDGVTMHGVEEFVRAIGAAGSDATVKIEYVRDGRRRHARVTLARRPLAAAQPLPQPAVAFRGASLGSVDPAMRDAANLPETALLVLSVEKGSPADRAGLTPGDVIVQVESRPLEEQSFEVLRGSGDVLVGLANGGTLLVKSQ